MHRLPFLALDERGFLHWAQGPDARPRLGSTADGQTTPTSPPPPPLGGGAAVSSEMRARVAELLHPGSPWAAQYPELLNISDHTGFPVHTDISDNVYDSDIWMQTTEGPANGFNMTTPKENAANLKAWLSTATNNTRV